MTGEGRDRNGALPMVSFRVPERTIARLDAMAEERGVTRTRVIRQLIDAGLEDRAGPPGQPPTEHELVALLSERARAGNVSAIRSLLAREHLTDPRERAVALFSQMVAERSS